MRCPNCGAEASTKFCPDCGRPLYPQANPIQNTESNNYNSPIVVKPIDRSTQQGQPYFNAPPKKLKESGLSILAFVVSFFACCGFCGVILGIIDLIGAQKEPVKRRHDLSIAAIVVGIIVPLMSYVLLGPMDDNTSKKPTSERTTATQSVVNDSDDAEEVDDDDGSDPSSFERHTPELPFEVSSNTTDMSIGEIANAGDFYIGLDCVRSLDYVQTAMSYYTEDIPTGKEVIYPIVQVYNNSGSIETFYDDISVYADSVQGNEPDTIYLVGVDGIQELQSYSIDSKETAVVIDAFVVDSGWTEITVYCGNLSWTITSEEISDTPYTYESMFGEIESPAITDEGTVLYDEDYELIYDGFEIYTYDGLTGGEKYAIFEFTINNTSDSAIDYEMVGYEMRGYCNSRLLDDADFIMDDTINGYSNVYDVSTIHAGMTSKVYVAYPILDYDTGIFECYYDTGYIINETIAHVCSES